MALSSSSCRIGAAERRFKRFGALVENTTAPMTAAITEAASVASLASAWAVASSKASPVMNSDTVKPMPATAPSPTMCPHRAPSGSRAIRSRTATHEKAATPTSLPTTRPAKTPVKTAEGLVSAPLPSSTPALARANNGTMTRLVHGCNASIKRSHAETELRIVHAAMRTSDASRSSRFGQHVDDVVGFQLGLPGDSGSEQAHDDAGDRGMHAGLEDGPPQHQTEGGEDRGVRDTETVERGDGDGDADGADEVRQIDVGGVEDGDHDDRADVVDDRQRQQQDLDRGRDTRTEERDHTEGEGDIGRHRNAPPCATGTAGVESGVQQCRHEHAAERGHRRKGEGTSVTELSDDQLTLDLHPDDEEEQRHEQVVDDVAQVLVELVVADDEAHFGRPHRLVAGRPDVRPDERNDRSGDEHDTAGHLDLEEAHQWLGGTCQAMVTAQERRSCARNRSSRHEDLRGR